jgi:hypothetical protein
MAKVYIGRDVGRIVLSAVFEVAFGLGANLAKSRSKAAGESARPTQTKLPSVALEEIPDGLGGVEIAADPSDGERGQNTFAARANFVPFPFDSERLALRIRSERPD